MSELINNKRERFEALVNFTRGLINGENGKFLFEKYREVIETVTPTDAMQLLDLMLQEGFSIEVVKANVGKIINAFYKSLNAYVWEKPKEGHFLYYLMLENREVSKIMDALKLSVKEFFNDNKKDKPELIVRISLQIDLLKQYDLHYIKKENILFPYIEKTFPEYRCLQLMWSFHDDFRQSIKHLEKILSDNDPSLELLSKELGKLFFVVLPIIFREEQIVFPVALKAIPEVGWKEMLNQSFETGWCYIETPTQQENMTVLQSNNGGKIDLGTGLLMPDQIILMLNTLPLDITFIDENDQVCYFSGSTHRIFPRSKAIISRKVQNCHPPESVHIVNEIVDAFKSGKKNHADFWIRMKGHFIHIRYFAIRDINGKYSGTMEVSQDVTDIRTLEGERRLLEWKE